MSTFAITLEKLQAQLVGQKGCASTSTIVNKADLAELLTEFERVDTAYRQLVPEYQQHIEQIQRVLIMTERLVLSEIGDYIAGLDSAGIQQAHNEQMQHELTKRFQRVLTDVKQHVAGWSFQETASEAGAQ